VGFNKLKCAIRRAACLSKITPNLELLNPKTCRPHLEYLYIYCILIHDSSGDGIIVLFKVDVSFAFMSNSRCQGCNLIIRR
jgi:hypothetical protein